MEFVILAANPATINALPKLFARANASLSRPFLKLSRTGISPTNDKVRLVSFSPVVVTSLVSVDNCVPRINAVDPKSANPFLASLISGVIGSLFLFGPNDPKLAPAPKP